MSEMYAKLFLFFILASAVYAVLVLARQDWRWHRGRIVQFLLTAAACVAFLVARAFTPAALIVAGGLFFLLGILPVLLQRLALRLITAGHMRFAAALVWLDRWLSWGPSAEYRRRGLSLSARLMAGDDTAAWETVADMSRRVPRSERAAAIAQRIHVNLVLRRWGAAAALFEEHFVPPESPAPARLAYDMVRAYCEMDDADRAARCLVQADAQGAGLPGLATWRLVAFTVFYAFLGRTERLAALLDANRRVLRYLPRPFPDYWMGIALATSGDPAPAAQALERADRATRPGQVLWRRAIAQWMDRTRSAEIEPMAPARPEAEAEVDALAARSVLDRRAAAPFPYSRGIGPVTAALILVNFAVWAMMEKVGSSKDMHTLLLFGANVPVLVRAGQYWRLISSMFIHVGGVHLVVNSYACYLFGTFLERTVGRAATFIIYMFAGLCGSAASALYGRHAASAGASGAICGLLGAGIVALVWARGSFHPRLRRLYAFNFIFIAVLNFVFGIVEPQVDNLAHGGGFAGGMAAALVMWLAIPRRRGRKTRIALGSVAVVLVAAALHSAHLAGRNVLSRGYPRRIPRFKTVESAELGLRVDLPAFWQVANEKNGRLIAWDFPFEPFEARFGLWRMDQTQEAERRPEPPPSPPGTPASPPEPQPTAEPFQAGDRMFLKVTRHFRRRGVRWLREVYVTRIAGELYVAGFECPEKTRPPYDGLLKKILATIQPVPGARTGPPALARPPRPAQAPE